MAEQVLELDYPTQRNRVSMFCGMPVPARVLT
jgi:hypothetical protein